MTLRTVGNINTLSSKFMWEIDDFSQIGNDVGDYLSSPNLNPSTSNFERHLILYPKGLSAECQNYLTIFLESTKAETDVKVTLSILNNDCEVMYDRIADVCIKDTCCTVWGLKQFVSRDFVMNPANGILNDDKLIIARVTEDNFVNAVLPHLQEKEGKTVNVHKCILAKSSPVFAAMFDAEMKENTV
ncbi:hypothetical protein TSAR_004133 [Trichomalopsis sarcophagae]|uniref:BTB domain-containing protein n=1 Tax=Trichomalopsis sarcophagae TaxID=543379 RepID=A0A232EVS5_9HYME|nr:hypothetical protein TSAR_004133 [Trichomalopsis sarcophagae]